MVFERLVIGEMMGESGRKLKQLLTGEKLIRAVGAHNGLTARLAERAGFEAVWASGLEISTSHALPDASLVSMTQFLDAADMMQAATTLPVIADCDTGFGGPLNVAHAVRCYQRRGIAGICIEDKIFPKVNSFAQVQHELLPAEEFVSKIKAGKNAQETADFVIIARTEALIAGLGIEEALDRAHSYAEAGADAILVHSKSRSPDEMLTVAAKWDHEAPLVAIPTTYSSVSEQVLVDAGIQVVIYANLGLRAAIAGVSSALAHLAREGQASAVETRVASMADVFELQGGVYEVSI